MLRRNPRPKDALSCGRRAFGPAAGEARLPPLFAFEKLRQTCFAMPLRAALRPLGLPLLQSA